MARANYNFEKRKRELDKKSEKAAKAARRAQNKALGISRANDGVPLEPLTGPNTGFAADPPDEPAEPAADPTPER